MVEGPRRRPPALNLVLVPHNSEAGGAAAVVQQRVPAAAAGEHGDERGLSGAGAAGYSDPEALGAGRKQDSREDSSEAAGQGLRARRSARCSDRAHQQQGRQGPRRQGVGARGRTGQASAWAMRWTTRTSAQRPPTPGRKVTQAHVQRSCSAICLTVHSDACGRRRALRRETPAGIGRQLHGRVLCFLGCVEVSPPEARSRRGPAESRRRSRRACRTPRRSPQRGGRAAGRPVRAARQQCSVS